MQEFSLPTSFIRLVKISVAFAMLFLLLGLALPLLPESSCPGKIGSRFTTILVVAVFAPFSMYGWRLLRKLPYTAICHDDDGIWYRHLSRNQGLIPWSRIAAIRERPYLQCLDLLDRSGNRLIRIEYQLTGFEVLRMEVLENIDVSINRANKQKFAKQLPYHALYWLSGVGFAILGAYVGKTGTPLLGYGGMFLVIILLLHEYLTSAISAEVTGDRLTIGYPLSTWTYLREDIESIVLADSFVKGCRNPEVQVRTRDRSKPHRLKNLGIDAHMLLETLRFFLNQTPEAAKPARQP